MSLDTACSGGNHLDARQTAAQSCATCNALVTCVLLTGALPNPVNELYNPQLNLNRCT